MKYYSQAGQDKWVHEMIGNRGVFVEVGAYDGIQTSNTYVLELLGWRGVCIEANQQAYKLLVENRDCIVINKAATSYKGLCVFFNDSIMGVERYSGPQTSNTVKCDTLNNLLHNSFCPVIDYMSLDIEGHELTALSCFDFDRWEVKLFTIEHNLYLDGPYKKDAIHKLLTSKGYTRVVEDVKCLDPNPLYFNQPFEDWYAKDSFYQS